MKRIIVFFILVTAMVIVIFNLNSSDISPSVLQSNENPDESSIQSQPKEAYLPPQTSSDTSILIKASKPDTPLYNTKSDFSIQAIDPEKDPANQIQSK